MENMTDTSRASTSDRTLVKIATVDVKDKLDEDDGSWEHTLSTIQDVRDMRRMGRNQQLVRHFHMISVASFVALATAAWELGIFMMTPALMDGGRPNLIYSLITSFIGFGPIYLSMAEMASMAPTAGAQYHWVSEFAPENIQRFLSFVTGWTSTLAWQAGNALGVFLVGTIIQSIISINTAKEYEFPTWHATLLVIGAVIIAFLGNTFGAKVLPKWQNAVFALHVLVYLVLIIVIWANGPKVSHNEVWTKFENTGGWSSVPVAVLVGQVTGIYAQVGVDTAAHMAEEVKDASKAVPQAIVMVYLINFVLTLPVYITFAYHMPSVADSLDDPTLYPAIYVMRQAMSPLAVTLMLVMIVLLLTASNITYLAGVTRDIFAIARDQGIPFSKWISRVDPKRSIPQNACIATSGISVVMALIYFGSPVAFYAITSLCSAALLQCYCLSIGCILWRRIYHPTTLPPSRFNLGRWGIPINIAALLFSAWSFTWAFWPQSIPVTAAGFNWVSAMFTAVVVAAAIDFAVRGRKKYHGPVRLVRWRFNEALLRQTTMGLEENKPGDVQ